MQRAPCLRRSSTGKGRETSFQSCTRSAMGRVGHFLRWISRKPVALPTRGSAQLGERRRAPLGARLVLVRAPALFVLGRHLDEARAHRPPVGEDLRVMLGVRVVYVAI